MASPRTAKFKSSLFASHHIEMHIPRIPGDINNLQLHDNLKLLSQDEIKSAQAALKDKEDGTLLQIHSSKNYEYSVFKDKDNLFAANDFNIQQELNSGKWLVGGQEFIGCKSLALYCNGLNNEATEYYYKIKVILNVIEKISALRGEHVKQEPDLNLQKIQINLANGKLYLPTSSNVISKKRLLVGLFKLIDDILGNKPLWKSIKFCLQRTTSFNRSGDLDKSLDLLNGYFSSLIETTVLHRKICLLDLSGYVDTYSREVKERQLDALLPMDEVWFIDVKKRSPLSYHYIRNYFESKNINIGDKVFVLPKSGNGNILNDASITMLAKIKSSHAQENCEFVFVSNALPGFVKENAGPGI